jgi:hypothetical protein
MLTLHRQAHCQVAPANTQTKTWQRVCLYKRTTDSQSGRKKNIVRTTACIRNSGFSGESKVNSFNKSQCQTECEVLLSLLLLIHTNRFNLQQP